MSLRQRNKRRQMKKVTLVAHCDGETDDSEAIQAYLDGKAVLVHPDGSPFLPGCDNKIILPGIKSLTIQPKTEAVPHLLTRYGGTMEFQCIICDVEFNADEYGSEKCPGCGQVYSYDEAVTTELTPEQIKCLRELKSND